MVTAWFIIIAGMLTVYVVLDGFDLGVGIVHLYVANSDAERRTTLAAIGPYWGGNEVWLIASGGILVYAFPKVYAAAFSGFYLPLMMTLWLLILRGISIELRSHVHNALWRTFWDVVFAGSSIVMTLVLGVALGNVIRGVPLDQSGYFSAPLFTHFGTGPDNLGAIDWYTALVGVFAVLALGGHGAIYLFWRTEGQVQERSVSAATKLWAAVIVVGVGLTIASIFVQPALFHSLGERPAAWPLLFLIGGGLVLPLVALRRRLERLAFAGSTMLIVGMLVMTASGLFPLLLRSTISQDYSLDAYGASTGSSALTIGLIWWIPAIILGAGYFIYLFRSFRGKVAPSAGYG